jgi:hypothetical protein
MGRKKTDFVRHIGWGGTKAWMGHAVNVAHFGGGGGLGFLHCRLLVLVIVLFGLGRLFGLDNRGCSAFLFFNGI